MPVLDPHDRDSASVALAAVVAELAELGPVSEIIDHAPGAAAEFVDLQRVVLTRIEDLHLVGEAAYVFGDPGAAEALVAELQAAPLPLGYPATEGEVLRRRRAQLIGPDDPELPRNAFSALRWDRYVAAPIVLDGEAVGFLHGDHPSDARTLDEEDARLLSAFATCFALVFERAVLRRRLRAQGSEMRSMADWARARAADPAGLPSLWNTAQSEAAAPKSVTRGIEDLRRLLTRRELEVLELMVAGQTNAGIARELVLSEGTIKFHVKNVLRKLNAANRGEAISLYLRGTLEKDKGAP
jgi:DNA-binding CsgD family transcriptional regulator